MQKLKPCVAALLFAFFSTVVVAEPVNINNADADEIAAALQGIGVEKAKAIVAYREKNGPYKSVDELEQVKGIGPVTISKNRDDILLEDPS
jgi:competence protein ComEA